MNKFKLIAFFISTLVTVGCASKTTTLDHSNGQTATATIEVPRYITALSVNNDEVTIPFMSGYPYYLNVAEGPVNLSFIYIQNWGHNDRSKELVKSNKMTLSFQADAGTNYVLSYDKPSSVSDPDNADYYLNSFNAWIEADQQQIAKARDSGEKSNSLSALVKQDTPLNTDRLTQLKQLWATSDADERKEFMNWVISPSQ